MSTAHTAEYARLLPSPPVHVHDLIYHFRHEPQYFFPRSMNMSYTDTLLQPFADVAMLKYIVVERRFSRHICLFYERQPAHADLRLHHLPTLC
jgi:hypothetical protein